MNLDELKNIWKEEDKNLSNKIKLNENLLAKMNMENITGEFNQLLQKSLLGRNLALVYCFISITMAILMLKEIAYSLPVLIGGLAMLWSFVSHLSIEKLNYNDSVVQLQKKICRFRMHTAAHAKYDMAIVALWLLTLAPVFLKRSYNIALYSNLKALSIFCLVSGIVVTLIITLSRKTYKEYDQKLKNSEAYLTELIKFEKNE